MRAQLRRRLQASRAGSSTTTTTRSRSRSARTTRCRRGSRASGASSCGAIEWRTRIEVAAEMTADATDYHVSSTIRRVRRRAARAHAHVRTHDPPETHMIAKRLDNIDVLCTDVEPMRAFYGEVLGLPLRLPYEPGQGWVGFRAGDVVIYLIEEDGGRATPPAAAVHRRRQSAGDRLVRVRGRQPRRRDRRARRARRLVGGRDRRVGVVPLPRAARSRGQPRVPDRAAAGPPRPACAGAGRPRNRARRAVIDCDVHNVVGSIDVAQPYLDEHWREVIATTQFAGPTDQPHPPNLADVAAKRARGCRGSRDPRHAR